MKHLVDLDDDALARARRHLGTTTIKATVNAALRLASGHAPATGQDLDDALDTLASIEFDERTTAWR